MGLIISTDSVVVVVVVVVDVMGREVGDVFRTTSAISERAGGKGDRER